MMTRLIVIQFLPVVLRKAIPYILLLCLTVACAGMSAEREQKDFSKKNYQENPFIDEWKKKAEGSKPIVVERDTRKVMDVAQEKAPEQSKNGLVTNLEDMNLPVQKVSVRFVDDDIANVLRALGRMGNVNIIINPSVKGTINAHVTETPWDVVFKGIINTYGLVVNNERGLLRIMTIDDLKLVVDRDKLQAERGDVIPLATRIVPVEFSNPEELAPSVKELLAKDMTGKPRGSVTVDSHSRALVITDTVDNVEKITNLIRELDKPTNQVLIEAHIVETTQDTARELGTQLSLNYSGKFFSGDQSIYSSGPAAKGSVSVTKDPTTGVITDVTRTFSPGATGGGLSSQYERPFNSNLPANPIGGIDPGGISFALANGIFGNILELQLSALQKAGKVNILSSPSIATLDNNEAVIESGSDVPFQTVQDSSTKIEYRPASLKLTVIPHVISDQHIKLKITAQKDEIDPNRSNWVGGNPVILKKLAKTELIVENGATVVIAGLSKERSSHGYAGIPMLKDMPVFGWLFKNDSRSGDFEELIIFITPQVLNRMAANVPSANMESATGGDKMLASPSAAGATFRPEASGYKDTGHGEGQKKELPYPVSELSAAPVSPESTEELLFGRHRKSKNTTIPPTVNDNLMQQLTPNISTR